MPRDARLEELGLPLHVIAQGIESRWIFLDDLDRREFVRRALHVFAEMGIDVLAWALMNNHLHFGLQPTGGRAGKAMQRVLGGYAQHFNRRHGRVGRLFRDRFWSRPVEDENDLAGLIAYVILNPLRGGIVKSLAELRDYPWTSLAELISPPPDRKCLVQRASALGMFGQDETSAIGVIEHMITLRYRDDPEGKQRLYDEPGGGLARRARTDLRTDSLLALRLRTDRIEEVLRRRESASALRLLLEQRRWSLDRTIARASSLCNAVDEMLRNGSRRRPESRARALVAYFAGVYLGCADVDVARATGVSRQAINSARNRGVCLAERRGLTVREFFAL